MRLPLPVLLPLLLLLSSSARADFADHYARRDDTGLHKAPVRGKNKLVVIPVEVAGHPVIDMDAARVFFESDQQYAMREFYKVTSEGKFDLEAKVLDKIKFDKCPLPETIFPNCAVKRGDPNALKPGIEMLREILRRADAANDFSKFDLNGADGKPDGFVDMVGIVTNTEFGGIALPIYYMNDGDNLAGGTGGPMIVDGMKIPIVAIGGGNTVMLHEFGHVLGLTDLYSEEGSYGGLTFSAMGDWAVDFRAPLFDAETRYRLGWTKVQTVSGTVKVTLVPASEGGKVYKLGTGLEYFLVENRTPGAKFDRGIQGQGLAIYHVDKRVGPKEGDGEFLTRLIQCVNCDKFHPYIMNLSSNGKFEVQNNPRFKDQDALFREGQSLLPDPSGKPIGRDHQVPSTNYYDGTSSGIRIEEISAAGGGSFSVTLTAPVTTRCAEGCEAKSICPESECVEAPPAPPVVEPPAPKGCGCSAGEGTLSFAALAIAALLRRRASAASLPSSPLPKTQGRGGHGLPRSRRGGESSRR